MKLKLDFIKRVLIDAVNNEDVRNNFFATKEFPSEEIMKTVIDSPISHERLEGYDHPQRGHTMIGLKRLNNVHTSLDYIRENNIEGDIIETGVWRGGCCIFIKIYTDLYKMDKKIFVADSFEGLPKPSVDKYPADKNDQHYTYENLKVSLEEVKHNFELYNALGDNVIFLKGWFSDTLANNDKIKKLSVLRFDGDMYGSTIDVLSNLYDKVIQNGIIIIDDYCLPNCAKAVTDFRTSKNITDEIKVVDRCGVWWVKNK